VIWLGIALLGGAGAVSRVLVDARVRAATGHPELPLGTLAVNLTGSLVLGLLAGLDVTGDTLLLAGTGFLGAFTTFSTWMVETERLAGRGHTGLALLTIGLSIGLGLTACGAGWAIGSAL
jgi:CrcB protein